MKPSSLVLSLAVAAGLLASSSAFGQSLTHYLQDKSDAVLRLEIVTPPGVQPPEATLWGRIKKLLGIRQVARIQPPVGTKLIVQASAYASSPYQTDATPCITAAGTRVRPGVVATNFLPLGTILEINGLEFIVEDRMNARYDGYYMDLWFPSTTSALTFGRKKLEITITGYGQPGQNIRVEEASAQSAPAPKSVGLLDRVRQQLAAIGQLLGAKSATELNRHDIDCLQDS